MVMESVRSLALARGGGGWGGFSAKFLNFRILRTECENFVTGWGGGVSQLNFVGLLQFFD